MGFSPRLVFTLVLSNRYNYVSTVRGSIHYSEPKESNDGYKYALVKHELDVYSPSKPEIVGLVPV